MNLLCTYWGSNYSTLVDKKKIGLGNVGSPCAIIYCYAVWAKWKHNVLQVMWVTCDINSYLLIVESVQRLLPLPSLPCDLCRTCPTPQPLHGSFILYIDLIVGVNVSSLEGCMYLVVCFSHVMLLFVYYYYYWKKYVFSFLKIYKTQVIGILPRIFNFLKHNYEAEKKQ